MECKPIKVLIVEDDPMVADINKRFTEAVTGFIVVGIARNGHEALAMLDKLAPDLLILDIYLPQIDGAEVLAAVRQSGRAVDIILITAANDTATINKVMRQGIIDYIIKPFKFDRYAATLKAYRTYYSNIKEKTSLSQADIDNILAMKMSKSAKELPKNLHNQTLNRILAYMLTTHKSQSAEEVAAALGISRVTARRYLAYLVAQGQLQMVLEYVTVGRPLHRFTIKTS